MAAVRPLHRFYFASPGRIARRCSSTALQPESPSAPGVDVISHSYKVRVFRSAKDLNPVALATWRRCVLGSALGMLGSLALAFSQSSWFLAMPGLAGPTFLCWLPSRLRQLAAPFVEEMFLHVPITGAEEEIVSTASGPSEGPAVASSPSAAAASAELLNQIQTLELEVIGPAIIRHLVLEDALETKPLLRKAGVRSDPRCTFAELCARPSSEGGHSKARRGPLHIDPLEGTSCDASLLAGLLTSPKVLALEDLVAREEASWPLRLTEAEDLSEHRLPSELSELESLAEAPEQAMLRLGRMTLLLGVGLGAVQCFAAMKLAEEGEEDPAMLVAGTRYR